MLIIVEGFIRWPQTPTWKIDQSRYVTGTLHKFSEILHHPDQSELSKTGDWDDGIHSKFNYFFFCYFRMDVLVRLITSVVDNVSLVEAEKERNLERASQADIK